MLVTVIIFLREVLEAALIFSVLLAVSFRLNLNRKWILPALLIGICGAAITAYYLGEISNLLDGTGQEIMNSAFLLSITTLLGMICLWLASNVASTCQPGLSLAPANYIIVILIMNTGLAIVHEGSEISIYSYSFIQAHDSYLSLIIGGGIGFGIGASLGAIIYYLLINLQTKTLIKVAICILILISAGMSLQAASYLIQSGWLPSQLPLWDTSSIVSERSLLGQLLYALIGYESTPTLIEVIFYFAVPVFLIPSLFVSIYVSHNKSRKKPAS